MFFAWLKRYLPRSLFSRTLLIFSVPVISIQIVVTVIFIQRHYAGVTEQMAQSVAQELTYAVETVNAADTVEAAQQRLDALAIPLGLFLTLEPGRADAADHVPFFDLSGDSVVDTLQDLIPGPVGVDTRSEDKVIFVQLPTAHGVLMAEIPRRRMVASNPHLLLVWMIVTSGVLSFIAILFLRNQVRPIRQLARAAEEFGKGRAIRFRPAGAEEVRRAGAAFLSMRARIERQIEQRTRMLSGVSHDLRTPLTRMKLALAVSDPTPETAELEHDVNEMERMLEGFLAFARGEGSEEAEETDPVEIAEQIGADSRRAGMPIRVQAITGRPEERRVILRPIAVKRAVQNLVDNALTYGDSVALTVRILPKSVEFIVEDDGPGIPEEVREEALRPFVRLDPARNQDTGGGVGLGLSIAMDVARSHGGVLELGESQALGGLRALVRLPR